MASPLCSQGQLLPGPPGLPAPESTRPGHIWVTGLVPAQRHSLVKNSDVPGRCGGGGPGTWSLQEVNKVGHSPGWWLHSGHGPQNCAETRVPTAGVHQGRRAGQYLLILQRWDSVISLLLQLHWEDQATGLRAPGEEDGRRRWV